LTARRNSTEERADCSPWPEIGDLHLEPAAHLPIGVLRKTNCARLRNTPKPRGDIDAVAHEVAVALLDDVAVPGAEREGRLGSKRLNQQRQAALGPRREAHI
jgi:hypothetical protein